jgi:murein DD-endopeptidase MepM/ murein hydrolase activator NlpD
MHAVVLALILVAAFTSFFVSRSLSLESSSSVAISGLSLPGIGAAPVAEAVLDSPVLTETIKREEVGPALENLAAARDGAAVNANADAALAGEAEAAGAAVQDPYSLYTVKIGDSASQIAAAHGISLQYLLWANPDLQDGELLTVGHLIVVPSGDGLIWDVRQGETLSDIAARFGVDVDDIVQWGGNNLASADALIADQSLFIPGGTPPSSILPPEQPAAVEAPVAAPAPVPAPAPAPAPVVDPGPVSSVGLVWPAYGPISSYMDGSHPLGIDIDMYNNVGAPVGAATEGTVTFVGGSTCCSYGLYVVVMSPGGIETLYAHFSGFAVSQGQYVSAGQTLGYAGCTGYCTGTHLHFEVIDNGVRVNPLNYLP